MKKILSVRFPDPGPLGLWMDVNNPPTLVYSTPSIWCLELAHSHNIGHIFYQLYSNIN